MEQKEDQILEDLNNHQRLEPVDDNKELQELLPTLEQQTGLDGRCLFKYQGLWCSLKYLRCLLSFQTNFKCQNIDVILATSPKSGTTWLKALAYSIATRHIYAIDKSPLLTCNPHELVRYLEMEIRWDQEKPNLDNVSGPRIYSTHLLYEMLPEAIIESECRIIYICRNPLDQFVSLRHFLLENKIEKDAEPLDLEDAFDTFCRGIHPQGPFWDHMLGYWNAHLKNPRKVLFLKYEDLKEEVALYVMKIAEFMGFPFSPEEEEKGLVEEIVSMCSFDTLRNLEVNKSGKLYGTMKKSSYFRKGEVGNWTNHLTPAMAERLVKMTDSKLQSSGITFKALNIKGDVHNLMGSS